MLQSVSGSGIVLKSDAANGERDPSSFFDISFAIGLLRRRKLLIAAIVAAFALAGLFFVLVTPVIYKAASQVIIDPRRLDLFQKDSLFTGAPVDAGTIESHVQLVGSERIATKVIDQLKLQDDPEFNGQLPSGPFQVIKSFLGLTSMPSNDFERRQAVLENFEKKLEARRVGLSYVIEISFRSLDASRAARIANAIANTCIEDMSDGRLSAMQRASTWLEGRLEEVKQRAMAAEQALTAFKTEHGLVGTGQIYAKLRELESNANTARSIYESFLQRYMQTMQQQSFPTVEGRIAALATPPSEKYSPKTLIILAIALMSGLVTGIGAALVRELMDRSVHTGEQLAAATGVPCLGALPEIRMSTWTQMVSLARRTKAASEGQRTFVANDLMSVVQTARFSRFAETIRSIKISADMANLPYRCRVIGVSSCLSDEGKSTVAANLALLMAAGGASVLLIDADLRNPGLSRAFAPHAGKGICDAVNDPAELPDAVWRHATLPNLEFLPVQAGNGANDSCEVLGSERMQRLLAEHTGQYQYVVLDLPPIAPVVDVRAASNLMDGMVLVTRWGSTSAAVIKKTLASSGAGLTHKLLGAVMNRVDIKRLKDYEGLDETYYYSKYYLKYDHVKQA